MKKYISAFLSIGTILILFYTLFDLKEQVKQVPLLQKQLDSVITLKDSLYDETFRLQIELGRYQLSFNHLQAINKPAAKQFINYLDHETE